MYCKKCGNPMEASTAFCPACGTPVAAAPAPSYEQADLSGSILTWGILGLAFALNMPILGIIFSKIGRNKAKDYLNRFGPWTGKTKVGAILAKAGIITGWCMLGFLVFMILYFVLVFALIAGID